MVIKTKKVLSCLVVCLLVLSAMSVSVFAVNTRINAPEAASNETLFDIGNPISNIREAMDNINVEDTYNSSNKSTTAATTTSTKIAVYSDDKSISDTSKTGYGLSYYADALRAQGYTVTQIYDPITSSKLDGYGALLIIGLNEYLSSSEKDAIYDFVENKERGLLLSGGTPSIVNDLAQKFDGGSIAWFGNYVVCDPTDYEVYPKWVKIKSFNEHQITENVDRIIMYKGSNVPAAWYYGGISSCAYSDDDSWLDEDGDWVYDSGESRGTQPVLATSVFDKIVIVPDGNVFDNLDADGDGVVAFNEYDNRVLGLNIAKWLAGGGGSSQEVQFKGTVTNIYSFYSATEYTIRIDEVISDPTNSMHEGDTAKVSYSSGSSAQVDSVEVGDKVEVRGVYTGYESGEHAIALDGSGSRLVKGGDITLLWTNETLDCVYSVSVSENGEYVAVGSKDTYVYYFNKLGDLEWKYKTNGAVRSVSISDDGNYVIAGSEDQHIYYFNKDDCLWEREANGPITTVDISSDGRYAVAGSWDYSDKYVYFFDSHDQNKLLWKRLLEGPVNEISISDNGDYIAIGGWGASYGDKYVYLLDKYNTEKWKKDVVLGSGSSNIRVDISGDGNYVIVGAGSNGETTYVYKKNGGLEWDNPYDEHRGGDIVTISSVSLSTDGSYSVVGTYGWDITIRSFDKTGKLLWRIKNDSYAVDISGDGHYIAAGASSSEMGERVLYIDNFDNENTIYDYSLEDPVWEIDLSKGGKYFAAAAKNTVYFFGSHGGNPEPNITAQIYSNGWKPVESFSIYPQATRDIKFTIENRGWGSNLGYIDISVSNGLDISSWEDDSSGYMSYENLGHNSNNPTGKASYSDGSRRVPQFELLSGYKPFGSGEKNTVNVTVKATGESEQWIKYRASMKSSDDYVRDPSSGDVDQQGWHAYNITVTVDGIQPDVVIPVDDEYSDWISIGDINDDGLNDIVMENGDIFYQQMDNSFLSNSLGFNGICVCTGKINNDDLNDIVMTSHFSEPPTNYGLIHIYYQQNDNTFKDAPDLTIETGYWAKYCRIDDINDDGLNDILVGFGIIGSTGETSTKIFYQKEDGSFGSTPDVDATWLDGIVSLSDFNQDGLKDLVGETASTWGLVVYYQSPDHTFDSTYDERMTHLPFGVDTLFKGMGDVDGNGVDDIIYNNNRYPDQSVVYSQLSDHSFIPSDISYVAGRDVNSIDIGDLNDDGQNDVAIFYDEHTFKGPGFIGIYYQNAVKSEVSVIDLPINSDIEVGGTLYRWYKTTPSSTIYIDSQYLDYHQPNEDGVFNISFNTSKHGITSPQTIDIVTNSVILTKDGQDIHIDPAIFNFKVDVVPRNYTTLWFWEESAGAGGGIVAYAKGERTINFQMETGNLDSILEMRRYKDDKITIGVGGSLFEKAAGVVKVGAISADEHGDRRNLYGSQVSVDYENADDNKKLEGILYILTSELATDPTPLVFEAVEAISNELSKDLPVDYYESGIAGGAQTSVYLMSVNIGPKEVDIVNQDIMGLNLEMGVSFVDRVYPNTNYEEYITQHTYKFDKGSAISVLGDEIIKLGDTEYIDVSTIVGTKDSNILGKIKVKNSEERLGLSDYKYTEVTHDYGIIHDEDLANQISNNKLKSKSFYSDFIKKEDIKENAITTISETRGAKKGFKLPISVEIYGAKVYLSRGDISASENNYILEKIVYKDSKPYIQEKYRYDGYVSNPAGYLSEIRMLLSSPLNDVMKDISLSVVEEIIKAGMKAIFNNGMIAFGPSTQFSDGSSSVDVVISSFTPSRPSSTTNALLKSAGLSPSYVSSVSGSYFVIGNITDMQPYNVSFEPASQLNLNYSDYDISGIDESKILIYKWDSESAAWTPRDSDVNADLNTVSTNITSFGTYAVGYDVTKPTIYWNAGNISYGGIKIMLMHM